MVLKRSVPLLQQEEEEFGPDEGIHGETHNGTKKLREKTETKTKGKHTEVTISVGSSFTILRNMVAQNEETGRIHK